MGRAFSMRMLTRAARRVVAATVAVSALAGLVAVSPAAPARAGADFPTIDGEFSGTGAVTAGSTVTLRVVGRGGVPSDGVGAVALNLTVTRASAPSFVTVWPTGAPRPLAATATVVAGETVSNMAIVGVGDGGTVSLFNYAGSVDLIVDVLGWFTDDGAGFRSITPARLHDSRPGHQTVDGESTGTGPMGAGATAELRVAGRGGVPADGVGAVAVNVTVTGPTAGSFLTVWPTGLPKPVAATVGMAVGETVSNMVVVGVGDRGTISLFNHAGSVDVVVDVLGWFPVGDVDGLVAVTPARVHETRVGYSTVDGAAQGGGALGAQDTARLDVLGRGGVPAADVGAVVLNLTVTNPSARSFMTVWPTGRDRPLTAALAMEPGETASIMVIAGVGDGGSVSMFNLAGTVDVVVDVLGWFPRSEAHEGRRSYHPITPARLQDTRVPLPPPREPGYPRGRCDTLAPGMDGLALHDDEVPDAYERIGTSSLGQPIWAEYYGPPKPKQVVLVVAQVHGNECAPSRFVRAVRAMSPRPYGIWLIPTLNPDGYAWFSRYSITGRDLNTDGWTWHEPETRALMELTARVRPVLTIHVHSPNGVVGWHGTGAYIANDPWRSQAPISGSIAQYVHDRSGLGMEGAGVRSDRGRWFLWQGQQLVHPDGETLLVELHAVSDIEVPFARPRPPTQPVAVIDAESRLVLDGLDRALT